MADTDTVVVCANRRLARRLREVDDAAQVRRGLGRWAPLDALTLDAWLARLTDEALLAGRIDAHRAPRLVLSPIQERLLWERAIAAGDEEPDGDATAAAGRERLAALAAEANDLAEIWALPVEDGDNEETRAFLRWRRRFRAECAENGWLESARHRAWQIATVAGGACRLPARVRFAGFDRFDPQQRELMRLLSANGVAVEVVGPAGETAAEARLAAFADRRAECRAAAAWAAERLAREPQARLAIVVPELSAVRAPLAAALDDALHPEALRPANAEMPRRYNFSLGAPLAAQPLAAAALALLGVAAHPRRVTAAEFGALLCGAYWSASESEADGRARLDAWLRERMPPELDLTVVLPFARRLRDRGLRIARCVAHLETLADFAARHGSPRRPSQWAAELVTLLEAVGWPGERGLSSHEWQTKEALLETLAGLDGLDPVTGRIGPAEAVRLASRLVRERIFQPETEGTPAVEVLGPLEAAGASFDAIWVLGMNDDVWPPMPRPNPLLPAEIQRRARSPHASAEVELAFARAVHERLQRSAPEVLFSYASTEGDRPLRPSPLLAALPVAGDLPVPQPTAAERRVGSPGIESLDDHCAPPLPEGAHVEGGTALLRVQALCPAWAFYRYRLGAKALPEPEAGLDAAERGSLLHRAMEHLWRGRDSRALAALDEAGRIAVARAAASAAIEEFGLRREAPLPRRWAAIETEHLTGLLAEWLDVDCRREVPFSVIAAEARRRLAIEGLEIDVALDRLDELADGRRLLIDYKTGATLKKKAWEGERIAEPQLPAYAAFALDTPPEAIAFARVRPGECAFIGIGGSAPAAGIEVVEDWAGTLARWRASLAAIAREIRDGEAGVRFAREADLEYCEVLPLLRLPEREETWR